MVRCVPYDFKFLFIVDVLFLYDDHPMQVYTILRREALPKLVHYTVLGKGIGYSKAYTTCSSLCSRFSSKWLSSSISFIRFRVLLP